MKKNSLISATCVLIVFFVSARAGATNTPTPFERPPTSDRQAIVCKAPLSSPSFAKEDRLAVFSSIRDGVTNFARQFFFKKTEPLPEVEEPSIYKIPTDEGLRRYFGDERVTKSLGRSSDEPGMVLNPKQLQKRPESDPDLLDYAVLPDTLDGIHQMNSQMVLINHTLTMNSELPALLKEKVSSAEAFRRIHASLMKNVWLVNLPEQAALDKILQMNAQKYRLRQDKKTVVGFSNSVSPHGAHMELVMNQFFARLDYLMGEARDASDAYSVAVWARHSILELQPAIDGNTRAARTFMPWIVTTIGKRLGFETDVTKLDMDSEEIPNSALAVPNHDGIVFIYDPFSAEGLKSLLSSNFISDIQVYSISTGKPFYYLVMNGSNELPGATNLHAAKLADSHYLQPDRPEWKTVRDFEIKKIQNITLKGLKKDAANFAETEFLFDHFGPSLNWSKQQ